MVKATEPKKTEAKPKERQPAAVFCPNCGVPKSTSMKLIGFLGKKKTLRFFCTSCRMKITLVAGWSPKGQGGEDFGIDVTAKDIIQGAKTTKQLIGAIKGI
jgi:hypothetical protein